VSEVSKQTRFELFELFKQLFAFIFLLHKVGRVYVIMLVTIDRQG
jgi:hypothetical protein